MRIHETNPFRYLRKRAGLSTREFSTRFGFARQTLIGIESGMYPELSKRMILSIEQACNVAGLRYRDELLEAYGVTDIQVAYEEWQMGGRSEKASAINLYVPVDGTQEQSPMALMIAETVGSTQGFAKQLKIPPATLNRYAKGHQVLMPKSVEKALRQIQYPYLRELIAAQANWAEGH